MGPYSSALPPLEKMYRKHRAKVTTARIIARS
jgi:hypothetical protein